MITEETLDKLRNNQQKPNFGSQAKEIFINGVFNHDNWNGGDGVIRQYCGGLEWSEEKCRSHEIDWYVKKHLHSGDIVIQYAHFNDFNYITLIVRGYDNDDEDSDWYVDQYLIQYYKSQGKTNRILYNGSPISEEQYLVLLNMIEQTGFKFRIKSE